MSDGSSGGFTDFMIQEASGVAGCEAPNGVPNYWRYLLHLGRRLHHRPDTSVTPEPLSITLVGTGLGGLVGTRRRRKVVSS